MCSKIFKSRFISCSPYRRLFNQRHNISGPCGCWGSQYIVSVKKLLLCALFEIPQPTADCVLGRKQDNSEVPRQAELVLN